MTDNMAAELGVRRTLAEYCQTCDDGRFEEFAACFAVDTVVHVRDTEVRGREAVRDWITAAMPPERRGKHVAFNPLVTVTGDRATASTDFLFVALGADGPRVTNVGRYVDELRLEDGRWVFTRRDIELLGPAGP